MNAAAGPPPSRFARRLPILALAVVSLLAGLWAGLLRLGFDIPELDNELAGMHGPLMVLGFLGTQIGLERAVALRRGWAYVIPAGAGAGSLWLLFGLPEVPGKLILALAGLLLVWVFIVVHGIEASWHNAIMGLGAVSWAVAAIAWLCGADILEVVPWLAGFLILTIVGERLELSRMARPPGTPRWMLFTGVAVFSVGLILNWFWPDVAMRVAGAGLILQVIWLVRYDIARRTIKQTGATRFMAAALLAGYVWLALSGVLWLADGGLTQGTAAYDAMLHTVFLGFVFSMIFAHAPVIVPAVMGVKLPYRKSFYLPLVLLHGGLLVRLIGDAAIGANNFTVAATGAAEKLWRTGGVLDEVAILLYLALAFSSAVRAARAGGSSTRPPATAKA